MDIRYSKEIIQDILERYTFSAVYADSCNRFGIETSKNYVDNNDAIDFLYSSAVIGSKALGIFNEVPFFHINTPLRAEFLIITFSLPKVISTPVIIIKKPEDISTKLTLALKLTVEHKIPVTVVITENALNNYTSFNRSNADMGRISPYISPATFKQNITQDELLEIYANINSALEQQYNVEYNNEILSLLHKEGYFPEFLLPSIMPESIKNIKSKNIEVYESEKAFLHDFFQENYNLALNFSPVKDRDFPEINDLLCPGCPFVNIMAKGVAKDTIIFTDINCKGVLNAFPELNHIAIDGYIGIISSEVRSSTLFIGNASSYKIHYNKFLNKTGRIILLNDIDTSKINGFSYIKHPKKLTEYKNVLYPYSCNNIKKYSKVKVKLNKCQCAEEHTKCNVFEKTLCPAIYKLSNNILIDNNICNGCLACKTICSKGAIS